MADSLPEADLVLKPLPLHASDFVRVQILNGDELTVCVCCPHNISGASLADLTSIFVSIECCVKELRGHSLFLSP